MQLIYKKTTTISKLLINCALGCALSGSLSGCALFNSFFGPAQNHENAATEEKPLSERQKLLLEAENFYKKNNLPAAQVLFLRISRFNDGDFDPVYDQALWYLAKINEKNNEPDKVILSLDELADRRNNSIPKTKINFLLMKSHYRITNFTTAQKNKAQIDDDYKNRVFSLDELADYLLETSELTFDKHLQEDLLFLGEIQKYFVYVMENPLSLKSQELTERLINNYEIFFTALKKNSYPAEFKKKMSVSLYDQLTKFEQYQLDDSDSANIEAIARFAAYCQRQKKQLIEGFNNDSN